MNKLAAQGFDISVHDANCPCREHRDQTRGRRTRRDAAQSSGVQVLIDLNLVLSEVDFSSDLDARARKFRESLASELDKLSEKTAGEMLSDAEDRWPEVSQHARDDMLSFRKGLHSTWKEPIEKFRMLRAICFELGCDFARDLNEKPPKGKDSLREALVVSHVRSCQIAGEILYLIEGGFADGAMARCRSLHEIAVIVMFLSMCGEEVARRYLAHRIVDLNKDAIKYYDLMQASGNADIGERDDDSRIIGYRRAMEEFGNDFRNPYGWAADYLEKRNPSFYDIEEVVLDDRARYFYRVASQSIHSGSRSLYSRPGIPLDRPVLLAGPSYLGFGDPGRWAAVSLAMTTVNVLALRDASNAQRQFEYSTAFRYVMACHDATVDCFQSTQDRIADND